jgi:hypothetical protein
VLIYLQIQGKSCTFAVGKPGYRQEQYLSALANSTKNNGSYLSQARTINYYYYEKKM